MTRRARAILAACASALFASAGSLFACAASPRANTVPIELTSPGDRDSGEIGGMVVSIEIDGRPAKLAIDTGSAKTFLYLHGDEPEWVPEHQRVRIGCEELLLPGRNLGPDVETDEDIAGVLGADFFIGRTTDFDPSAGRIVRYPVGTTPTDIGGFSVLPYEDVGEHVIVRLRADGTELRLMWDTGCPHLLWIGRDGNPGDATQTAQDVRGGQFEMHYGRADVEIAGEPARRLSVLRALRFPYFERTVEMLGGNIDGLAGQSVFGSRRMVFDPKRRVIHLGPRR